MPIKLLVIHFTIESLTCKNETQYILIPLCFKNVRQLTRKCCLIAATVGVIIFSRCVSRRSYVFNSLRDMRRLKIQR